MTKRWRPLPLIGMILFSALLLLSWLYFEPTRELWSRANEWVFFTFNGWVAKDELAQTIWGIANHRLFDLVTGSSIVLMFAVWFRTGQHVFAIGRIAWFLVFVMSMVAAIMLGKTLATDNVSPSGVLKPVYLLSELLGWSDFWTPKDYSRVSFPGDHGMALFLAAIFLWVLAGKSYGLRMLILAALFSMPRMVAGAHWFTDIAVGSVAVACFVGAWVLFTPLGRWLHGLVMRMLLYPPIRRLVDYGWRLAGGR